MLMNKSRVSGKIFYCLLLTAFCLLATSCRYDMQDQPRYKAYKPAMENGQTVQSWRDAPDGTVPRGQLRENKSLYTGKLENVTGTAQTNAAGQQITFPDSVTEFPMAVTQEVLDRGEQRYKIYCSVCHGNFGNGDGMIVRRGFPKPPSYHDDRLRNAPVGHFFDVASNGWGKMSGYSGQTSVSDRWAIVAYIRALQLSQNPNGKATATTNTNTTTPAAPTSAPATPTPAATVAPKSTAPASTPAATPKAVVKPANTNSTVRVTKPTITNTAGGNQR